MLIPGGQKTGLLQKVDHCVARARVRRNLLGTDCRPYSRPGRTGRSPLSARQTVPVHPALGLALAGGDQAMELEPHGDGRAADQPPLLAIVGVVALGGGGQAN